MCITLIKLLYSPLYDPKTKPDIHQGERLCGRLLPSVLRVSEKNSSRKLADQARYALVLKRISILDPEYEFLTTPLLGSS